MWGALNLKKNKKSSVLEGQNASEWKWWILCRQFFPISQNIEIPLNGKYRCRFPSLDGIFQVCGLGALTVRAVTVPGQTLG